MPKIVGGKKKFPAEQLLSASSARFEKNPRRHQGLEWAKVRARLEANPEKLWSLQEMERTGGEPDVVGHDQKTGEYIFNDCSAQTPGDRRSLCYDRAALDSTKTAKPPNSAMEMAAALGRDFLFFLLELSVGLVPDRLIAHGTSVGASLHPVTNQ